MKKVVSRSLFLLILGTLCSCRKELKAPEYVKYLQDERYGFRKVVKIEGWEYAFQYKPAEMIMLIESKGVKNDSIKNKRMKELEGTAWFNISFRLSSGKVSSMRYNLSSIEDYDKRYDYFLNHAKKHIRLVYGGTDTLFPMSYLFENNYNLTPQETMIVGFRLPGEMRTPEQNMQLIYEDEIFGNGIIKALFKKSDLKRIPELIY